jgi:hypothetical protein
VGGVPVLVFQNYYFVFVLKSSWFFWTNILAHYGKFILLNYANNGRILDFLFHHVRTVLISEPGIINDNMV